jgi:enamine deaminase RidA (YjgF/YER057c/UK114 family)
MKNTLFLITMILASSSWAAAEGVVRHANEASSLPISTAVEVNGLMFHSGVIPSPADSTAERGSAEFWGNTETQTDSVLSKIQASLQAKGLDIADIVKLNVSLVGDPANGNRMDFSGFMSAYTQYFGEASGGALPARAVVQVAGLVAPGMMVEIEAIAAR